MDRRQLENILKYISLVPIDGTTDEMTPHWHSSTGLVAKIQNMVSEFDESDLPRPQLKAYMEAAEKLMTWRGGICRDVNIPGLMGILKKLKTAIEETLRAPIPQTESMFPYIKDDLLRDMLDRDFMDARVANEFQQWKACIVLCGGIVEALLYEYLLRDPRWTMDAARKSLPKKDITKTDLANQWSLAELIKFAVDNGIIKKYKQASLDDVIRTPRNLIHPMKEVRQAGRVDQGAARMSLAMLEEIKSELESVKGPPP